MPADFAAKGTGVVYLALARELHSSLRLRVNLSGYDSDQGAITKIAKLE